MNDLDDRISSALHAAVDGLREQDLRPAEAPRTTKARGRRTIGWAAPLLTAAAVIAIGATTFLLADLRNSSHETQPGGTTTTPTLTPTPVLAGYEPLWPFADSSEARQWQTVDGPNGHSPWHADAKATALFFATGYLHFGDITKVTTASVGTNEADVGVGYLLPNGQKHTAAVVHLVRFGDASAPWEVVGTKDTTFSITEPKYGSQVTSPMTVGGRITGSDENIAIAVRTVDGDVDKIDPVPAGGDNAPWSVTVPFSEHGVRTVVGSTGGQLTAHERFAVIGVVTADS
jgi:hypothetical protein